MSRFVLESEPKVQTDPLEGWRRELDDALKVMIKFSKMNHTDIFISLSGFTARASYIRNIVARVPENRRMAAFRTKELEPFIEECDRQFKYWSRALSVQALDWEISKGV